MVGVVNGYFCRNCADVELAKRGVDPAHPTQTFHGSEAYATGSDDSRDSLGRNRPEASGSIGTKLNILG